MASHYAKTVFTLNQYLKIYCFGNNCFKSYNLRSDIFKFRGEFVHFDW
jgi:hypothetical protein